MCVRDDQSKAVTFRARRCVYVCVLLQPNCFDIFPDCRVWRVVRSTAVFRELGVPHQRYKRRFVELAVDPRFLLKYSTDLLLDQTDTTIKILKG